MNVIYTRRLHLSSKTVRINTLMIVLIRINVLIQRKKKVVMLYATFYQVRNSYKVRVHDNPDEKFK